MSFLLNFFSLNTIAAWALKLMPGKMKDIIAWLLVVTQGYKSLPLVLIMLISIALHVLAGAENASSLQVILDAALSSLTSAIQTPDALQQSVWYGLALTLADKLKIMLISDGYLRSGKWTITKG